MQIFLSHSSRQKPLVREIKKALPEHISAWIDEDRLIFGDNFPKLLEEAIRRETDYVILFLDSTALASSWVRQEVAWALQAEKDFRRLILLPIIIDDSVVDHLSEVDLVNRKHLRLLDYQESSVRLLASSLTSELFALLCRDMQELRSPKPKTAVATIESADNLVTSYADAIRSIVFPHREGNPLAKADLVARLKETNHGLLSEQHLDQILSKIVLANSIPGLIYDGFDLFICEEHARWKSTVQSAQKEMIARKAVSHIKNRMTVFLDAGSTTEEMAKILCTKVEMRAITQLSIATSSVNIADMLSDCCVKMGFDDNYCAMDIFIPGGRIRSNTQAIIPIHDTDQRPIPLLSAALNGFDLGFIGVNGVSEKSGFSTHSNTEYFNKCDIVKFSKKRIIVGDSSKIGLSLERTIASLDDEVTFITNKDENNAMLRQIAASRPNLIEWASQ